MSGTLLQTVNALFYSPTRSIGGVIPDCAIEEDGLDEMQITEHPVETGAPISDHAFKKPATVILRWSWSNGGIGADGSPSYVKQIYATLLSMQVSLEFIVVITGKRLYPNMLIASLAQHTDEENETTLGLTIECQQVIVVDTVAAPAPMQNGSAANQAQPQQTAPLYGAGTVSAQPLPNLTYNGSSQTVTGPGGLLGSA